jgi:hypothetical protein
MNLYMIDGITAEAQNSIKHNRRRTKWQMHKTSEAQNGRRHKTAEGTKQEKAQNQGCGAGAEAGRSRNFWPEPELEPEYRSFGSGSRLRVN